MQVSCLSRLFEVKHYFFSGTLPNMAENKMTVTEFARLGGLARAASLTAAERSAIAKKAVTARELKRRKARLAKQRGR